MMTEVNMVKNQDEEKGLKSRRVYSVNNLNKDEKLFIRVTGEEKAKLQQISQQKGISLSKMIMDLLTVAYL